MIDIRNLMQKCCEYPLNLKDSSWLTEVVSSGEGDTW